MLNFQMISAMEAQIMLKKHRSAVLIGVGLFLYWVFGCMEFLSSFLSFMAH